MFKKIDNKIENMSTGALVALGIIGGLIVVALLCTQLHGICWNPEDGIYWAHHISHLPENGWGPTYTYTNLTLKDVHDIVFHHGVNLVERA